MHDNIRNPKQSPIFGASGRSFLISYSNSFSHPAHQTSLATMIPLGWQQKKRKNIKCRLDHKISSKPIKFSAIRTPIEQFLYDVAIHPANLPTFPAAIFISIWNCQENYGFPPHQAIIHQIKTQVAQECPECQPKSQHISEPSTSNMEPSLQPSSLPIP